MLSRAGWHRDSRAATSSDSSHRRSILGYQQDPGGLVKHAALQIETRCYESSIVLHRLIASSDIERVLQLPRATHSEWLGRTQKRRSIAFELLRHTPISALGSFRCKPGQPLALMEGTGRSSVGIHALEVYLPRHRVCAEQLGASGGALLRGCTISRHAFLSEYHVTCGEDEDATSMALTVVGRIVHTHMVQRRHIGFINVGCSEPLDRSKSIKSDIMSRFEPHEMVDIEGLVRGRCIPPCSLPFSALRAHAAGLTILCILPGFMFSGCWHPF